MLGFIAYPVISVFYYSLQNYNVTKPWRNGFAGFDNFVHDLHRRPAVLGHARPSAPSGSSSRSALQLAARPGARADRQPDLRRPRHRPRPGLLALGRLRRADHHDLDAALQPHDRHHPLPRRHRASASTAPRCSRTPAPSSGRRSSPNCGAESPSSRSSSSPTCSPSPRTCTRRPRSTAPGRLRQFLHITLPHLQGRDHPVHAAARGVGVQQRRPALHPHRRRPAGETTTLPLYVANTGVDAHDFGYGSALTTVAFVILLFCSMVYLRLSKFGGDAQVTAKDSPSRRPPPGRPRAPPPDRPPRPAEQARRAWDEVPRWQIYLPLGDLPALHPRPVLLDAALRAPPGRLDLAGALADHLRRTSTRSGTSAASASSSRTACSSASPPWSMTTARRAGRRLRPRPVRLQGQARLHAGPAVLAVRARAR